MNARVAFEGAHTVVKLEGDLDISVKSDLRRVLDSLSGLVIVDLSAVSFVDSTAMGVIAFAGRRISGAGGELWLRQPSYPVRGVLQVMGFEDWIES